MRTILHENKSLFEWLTRDVVNSAYTRFKRRPKNDKKKQLVKEIHLMDQQISSSVSYLSESTHQNSTVGSSCRKRGGRPSGSTNNNKRKRTEKYRVTHQNSKMHIQYKRSFSHKCNNNELH